MFFLARALSSINRLRDPKQPTFARAIMVPARLARRPNGVPIARSDVRLTDHSFKAIYKPLSCDRKSLVCAELVVDNANIILVLFYRVL